MSLVISSKNMERTHNGCLNATWSAMAGVRWQLENKNLERRSAPPLRTQRMLPPNGHVAIRGTITSATLSGTGAHLPDLIEGSPRMEGV